MNLLLAFIAFDFIIIIHELGHFVVAKLSGIKVLEFSLFFGPKLFSIQRGETMYSVRLIPALAYVKLEGEEEASDSMRSYSKKPLLVRAAVLAAGPFLNIVLGLIFFCIIFSVGGYETNVINTVVKDSPAYIAGMQTGDKLVGYDQKSIYQPLEVGLFLYGNKGKPFQVELLRGEQRIKKTVTPQVIAEQSRYLLGFVPAAGSGEGSNVVKEVDANTPAGKAGLKVNDKIVKLNDTQVSTRQEINDFVNANKSKAIKVTVLRNGAPVNLEITPMFEKTPEQYYLGIDFKSKHGNIFESIGHSVVYTYSIVRISIYSLVWLVQGQVPLNQMAGPVGIVSTINDVVQQSPSVYLIIMNLLSISGFISIALGISNLLPIPPADGSKLVLLAVEGIRRKPLPIEKEAMIMMVGFVIMMMLFVVFTYNDIARLIMRAVPGG